MPDNSTAMVIAIDGPAASGKGTLAQRLALHYGLPHLDTGLLYRGVALTLLDAGASLDDEAAAARAAEGLIADRLADPRLR
ncbi:(d)CMP kinase, partial [Methylobacterium sp. WL6]|uniref:(d)CMP kinase n=1 Tax=Methylobacterium sp. WL6 TaxID=2603901 RepID=UPI0011D73806